MGLRLPLTTHLADRVRALLVDRAGWARFPDDVREWLEVQDWRSQLPGPDNLLVESFPHGGRHYTAYYTFAGWNANQALGMLITKRMEERGLLPGGFVANDYSLAVWGLKSVEDPAPLLSPDILTHEFVEWVTESHLLRRAFREVAVIAGLVERQHPGKRKSGKQVTFSTDLIYDVLRKYEPDHLLIEAAWADARARMTDIGRLGDLLDTAAERMVHVELERVSPLAVPVHGDDRPREPAAGRGRRGTAARGRDPGGRGDAHRSAGAGGGQLTPAGSGCAVVRSARPVEIAVFLVVEKAEAGDPRLLDDQHDAGRALVAGVWSRGGTALRARAASCALRRAARRAARSVTRLSFHRRPPSRSTTSRFLTASGSTIRSGTARGRSTSSELVVSGMVMMSMISRTSITSISGVVFISLSGRMEEVDA